jgi:tRNA threonylcarbamoyl adenosine modification protein YeaZ
MSGRMLVIDCATPALSIALFEGTHCVAARHEELGRGHAEALLPSIAALPEGGRCDSILVDVGPGSFTGVRVGLAAANALGFAWQVPVHGYSCLDLVAAIARARFSIEKRFAVVMIGGHGELFWAMSDPSSEAPLDVHSTPIAELAEAIDCPLLVGSGASILIEAGARGQAVSLLPDSRDALLLPERLRSRTARPIYGRGADAKPMRPAPARARIP